jgi:hypothetical protein
MTTVARTGAENPARKGKSGGADRKTGGSRSPKKNLVLADSKVSEGPEFARKNWILMGLGVGTIILGFVALALGSITLAPILLVLGYIVLVPWAILSRPRPEPAQQKRANSSGG